MKTKKKTDVVTGGLLCGQELEMVRKPRLKHRVSFLCHRPLDLAVNGVVVVGDEGGGPRNCLY